MLDLMLFSRHEFKPATELEATTQGPINLRVREGPSFNSFL